MSEDCLGDDLIVKIEHHLAIAHDQLEEIEEVLGVEFARMLGEMRRHIERRENGDRPDLDGFARLRCLAIATAFRAEIDDN